MKTFEEIYNEIINNENSEIKKAYEKAKIKNDKYKTITVIICLILDIIYFLITIKNMSIFFIMFILFINIFIYLIMKIISTFSKEQREYVNLYKNQIIRKFIENFYNNLEYFPYKEMPEYIYKECQYEYYNKYSSDDYFEALIDSKNSIQMAEILTKEERKYRDSDGNVRTETITKFHGLFAKIDLGKSIDSELSIMPNQISLFKQNKLEMDSMEFEKKFDVQASNKIIGMQILTSDIMQELLEFLKINNIKYDISIKNNELYIRFNCGPMFEIGKMKKGAIDRDLIYKYYKILEFTYDLSHKLIKTINDVEI